MSYTTRSGGPDFAPCVAALGELQEHSSAEDTALQDKLSTIYLKLSHHLKIYFCSFVFNIQRGTDSSFSQ